MSQFSTNESVSLEKEIENVENITKINDMAELYDKYELENCVTWIKQNEFSKICLQFPNNYLPDSSKIVTEIQNKTRSKVYLLADTAYESCCVDYVAAKHVNADSIIHFGDSCNSEFLENEVPVLKIHPKIVIDYHILSDKLTAFNKQVNKVTYLIFSQKYEYLIDKFRCLISETCAGNFKLLNAKDYQKDFVHFCTIFIGEEGREISNFQNYYNAENLFICDPNDNNLSINQFTNRSVAYKRRYFIIESIKDANTIGIVVGTLAVKNYLQILNRIRKICRIHRKKCYVFSVGKPNVAKLANFPEIDIFVIIACSANEIYDSRDFYKPIAMPYDIELALNSNFSQVTYNPYDYNEIAFTNDLPDNIADTLTGDISLLSGKLRGNTNIKEDNQIDDQHQDNQICVRNDMKMVESCTHGASYLANRSWQGLDQNLGETSPEIAVIGRKGLAAQYQNEIDPNVEL